MISRDALEAMLPIAATTLQLVVAIVTTGHAVLSKRDVRSAIGWIGLVWLVPFAGGALYLVFGVNRIRRRASDLRPRPAICDEPSLSPARIERDATHGLLGVARLLDRLEGPSVTLGNAIEAHDGGATAYRAMLTAIANARETIGLATYIFDDDRVGRIFVNALASAARRGVNVRALVDGVGARYSRRPIVTALCAAGVPAAEFLPTYWPKIVPFANLRNHRKILVVDGAVGFVGGMNIREGHLRPGAGPNAIADVHFRLSGPVVAHLSRTFVEDWSFATGEALLSSAWRPAPAPSGLSLARGVASGPDETFERIRWTLLAAISQARDEVRIVTPYFLPDAVVADALMLAALRGVRVCVTTPEATNLRLVTWAARAKLADLMECGCEIRLSPPPFDHAKLMTVDRCWGLIGSANWDTRSLRLNFEFDVECCGEVIPTLDRLIDDRLRASRPYTIAEANERSLATKLRDGGAWLLSPYL